MREMLEGWFIRIEEKTTGNPRLENPSFLNISAKDKKEERLQTNESPGKAFDEVSNGAEGEKLNKDSQSIIQSSIK